MIQIATRWAAAFDKNFVSALRDLFVRGLVARFQRFRFGHVSGHISVFLSVGRIGSRRIRLNGNKLSESISSLNGVTTLFGDIQQPTSNNQGMD